MQALDMVNDIRFRKTIHEFEPRCAPPGMKTIPTHYLPQVFETEKKHIREAIGCAEDYAVTTDLWTSRAKHAYTGLTVHYITKDFSFQSHLLETKELADTHTANNIAEKLEAILQE